MVGGNKGRASKEDLEGTVEIPEQNLLSVVFWNTS